VLHTAVGPLTATVSPNLQIVLRNAQGKIVRGLRSPDEAAREALQRLRRELPMIVEEQCARLQRFMTFGRIWRPEDIRAHLFAHPVVGRLCELMIFAGVDELGDIRLTFRPLADGSILNAASEPVSLAGCTGIRLAHRGLMDEPDVRAWQQHLEDYRIVPAFAQLR
jgi:hypothetical protein